MQNGIGTTSFGRRAMSLTLVKRRFDTASIEGGRPVNKWKVFRDAAEARALLGIQDRALAILDALLTFYPDNELSNSRSLIVFPSNIQLSARAHGIAGTTLRRHLAALVDAGLIHRRDSANGKRFARKGRTGEIEIAYGFDLSPLLARASELALMAQEVAAERERVKRLREKLTICRRDVRKVISAAIGEGPPGDWETFEAEYIGLVNRIPRSPNLAELSGILEEMQTLQARILNTLETVLNSRDLDVNGIGYGCHIQNSDTKSIIEFERHAEPKEGIGSISKTNNQEPTRTFPLSLVLKACPEISMYGPSGEISTWRELLTAAIVVRSMLGVSASAFEDACHVMGSENAATTMACILERTGHINSAGGYLRDLTSKARRGEFSLGPALMALLKVNQIDRRRVG